MRIAECASCFKNQTSGDLERIRFVYKGFIMKITKRPHECEQCAKRRHTEIFNRHNAENCLAAATLGGLEINWWRYVKIIQRGDAIRKHGATRVLLDLGVLSLKETGRYSILHKGMLVGPTANRFLGLYFKRKSDAAAFASIALMSDSSYEIIEIGGAA